MSGSLAAALEYYFRDYLIGCRGLSRNTVASYGHALRLFETWLKNRLDKDSARRIRLQWLKPRHVLEFLDHLEDPRSGRSNCASSRNARLAAIRSFFAAVRLWEPRYGPVADRIEHIPPKRVHRSDPDHLDLRELMAVFRTIDTSQPDGMRDATLFLFMMNSGARASEAATLKLSSLVLEGPFRHVKIIGKGERERVCPLWDQTTAMLKHYIERFRRHPRAEDLDAVFVNRRGRSFTRSGVLKTVKKYVARAADELPTLKRKRIRAHSIRHSTAVLLLKAGVPLSIIRSWLGHIRLDTTAHYARMTALDKRESLDRFLELGRVFRCDGQSPDWQQDPALLRWLESL